VRNLAPGRTITWQVPRSQPSGTYRIRYLGTSRSLTGSLEEIRGATPVFTVT